MAEALVLRHVSAGYGETVVLEDINLQGSTLVTFLWLAVLFALSGQLNELGFMGYVGERLTALLDAEDTLVLPTITLIHMSVIPVLAASGTIYVESRAHKTIYEGCQIAGARGATVKRFNFEDAADIEKPDDHVEGREARHVIGVDHLEVGQVMPGPAHAVGPPGLLHGVQGVHEQPDHDLAELAPEPATEIPFKPSRMIHFFDASNEKMRAKVPDMAKQADILLGNLEDAIPVDKKVPARDGLIEVGKEVDFGDTQLWTRVNALESPWALDDLTQLVTEIGDVLEVIMVPKVEGPWDIHYVDRLLAQLEAKAKLEKPLLIHAILETSLGVVNLEEIATASPRMQGMSFGPAGTRTTRRSG